MRRSEDARPIDADNAWILLLASSISQRLAGLPERGSATEAWRGMTAAARALAYLPDHPQAWAVASTACSTVGAYRAGLAAAERALTLDPDGQPGRDAWVVAAANFGLSGELEARLDAVAPEQLTPWHRSVLAYALLIDRPGEALDILRAVVADLPTDAPVHWSLAQAMARLGRPADAEVEWRWLWRETPRGDDMPTFQVATAALELGYLTDAEELFDRLRSNTTGNPDDGVTLAGAGAARIRAGDPHGVELMLEAIALAPTPRYLADMRCFMFERLRAAGEIREQGAQAIGAAIEAHEAKLGEAVAPATELIEMLARIRELDRDCTHESAVAARLMAAQLEIATGTTDGALGVLAKVRELAPEITEISSLVERLTPEPPAGPEAGGEAGLQPGAAQPAQAQPPPIVLWLPEQDFQGTDDPLRQHELFVRCLPNTRSRLRYAGVELPPVSVRDLSDLGPGDFAIEIDGQLALSASIPAGSSIVPIVWLESLPPDLRSRTVAVSGDEEIVALPDSDATPLSRVVTLDRYEAIALALETAYTVISAQKTSSDQQQPPSPP